MTRRASWVCTVGTLLALTGCSSGGGVPEASEGGGVEGGAVQPVPDGGSGDGNALPPDDSGVDADAQPATMPDSGPDGDANGPDAADACPSDPLCVAVGSHCGAAETDGGSSLVTCAVDANGCLVHTAVAACGLRQTCGAESDGGAACICNTDATCASAGGVCTTAGLATCSADANGCFYVSTPAAACPAHEVCGGVAGSASCACSNDTTCSGTSGKVCSAGDIETCSTDGNGCIFVSTAASACPVHEACGGAAGAASCACNNDPTCTGPGQVCTSITEIETCSVDSNSCLFVSTAAAACTTTVANATADCASNACGITCDTTFHACGSGGAEQCLSNTSTQSCGTSCTPCSPPANSTATCTGTVLACGFTCVSGFHECGGNSCLDNTSVNSCGASCTACVPPANSTATCNGTACGFTCDTNYVQNGSTCVPPAPRLIAPISGSTMGTRKPTFSWSMPTGFTASHIDVCKDRACGTVLWSDDLASGSSDTPTTDIPSGTALVFWRVFAKDPSLVRSTLSSKVWELELEGTHDAPRSTAWGTIPDINGDGYADVVTTPGNLDDATYVIYEGGSTGLVGVLATWDTLSSTGEGRIYVAGDVNGDGFVDVLTTDGALNIHSGGPSGPSGVSSAVSSSASNPGTAGWELVQGSGASQAPAVGDVNGDGYADLIVMGHIGSGNAPVTLFVYPGSATGISQATSYSVTSTIADLGNPGAGGPAGDVNGDGYADFVLGHPSSGSAEVFYGSKNALVATSTQLTTPTGYNAFGLYLAIGAGDLDGDGYDDVTVGGTDHTGGTVFVFRGGASTISTTAAANAISLGIGGFQSGALGNQIALGDVNGDGYGDLGCMINGNTSGLSVEFVSIFFGGSGGMPTTAGATLTLPTSAGVTQYVVQGVVGAGDVNGDGYPDIAVAGGCIDTNCVTPAALYEYAGSSSISSSPQSSIANVSLVVLQ